MRIVQRDHCDAGRGRSGYLGCQAGGEESFVGGRHRLADGAIVPGIGDDAVLRGPCAGGQSRDAGGRKAARQMPAIGEIRALVEQAPEAAGRKGSGGGIEIIGPELIDDDQHQQFGPRRQSHEPARHSTEDASCESPTADVH